jgi:prolyl 4-hydroxylase
MSSLQVHRKITPTWVNWLQENLGRKVPAETLIETMAEASFDPKEVVACLASIQKRQKLEQAPGIPLPDHLAGDWQQWVVRNIESGVLESAMIEAATKEIRAAWQQRNEGLRRRSESQGYRYQTAPTSKSGPVRIDGRDMPILLEMQEPHIVHYENVLSSEECDAIIELAVPKMTPSRTHDQATAELVVRDFRSSSGCFFQRAETEFVQRLEQRLADLAQWPVENGEGLQVLQYRQEGEYRPHFDFFPPEKPTSALSLKNGGQRVATLIVYLNTVEEGGETYFPKLDLKIKPVKGSALYFSYTNTENELDRMTLHGGASPAHGEKWIMTKWMRQEKFKQCRNSKMERLEIGNQTI